MPVTPPRRGEPLTNKGMPTLRFSEFLESVSGDVVTVINEASTSKTTADISLALSLALLDRMGSGDFLTSDETGFTVDTDQLTVDQTEA